MLDITDSDALVRLIAHEAAGLEVLHYNAASLHHESLMEQSIESIEQDLAVTLLGALISIRQAAREMLARQQGTILVTGGGLALHPTDSYLTLGAGKAALRNVVQALAPSFAAQGVHIAILTITQYIAVGSPQADAVASMFWELYSEPRSQWQWELMK